jgi:NAD(P)-dependent dehydrogenase (short-subunit alcohol dehydrogenase family)
MGIFNSKLETKWFPEFVEKEVPSLEGKTVVVTGTTTGLGFIFAKTTIEKGAEHLLLLNRPSERANQAEKELKELAGDKTTVEQISCDLQDFASVREAASQIKKKYNAIDVLCLNAGIMAFEDKATKDGYDVQMQTNHLSHFLLTKELYPLLKKAKELRGEARVVSHTSMSRTNPANMLDRKYLEKNGGNLGGDKDGWAMKGPKWDRYQQSKLANSAFSQELARRLESSGIKAVLAHPGYSSTNLQTTSKGMSGIMWTVNMGQTVEDGTMPLLSACYLPTENGDFWHPTQRSEFLGPAKKMPIDDLSKDPKNGKLLWEMSEEACGKFEIS